MKNIISPHACPCGLPLSAFSVIENAPFEAVVWATQTCPARRGMCCLRKTVLKAVFNG